MKKKESGPDLFGRAAEIAKPAKVKPADAIPINTQIAQVSGAIAGLPDQFILAIKALEDAEGRCARSTASRGILTPKQAHSIDTIGHGIRQMLHSLGQCRKEVDSIIAGGIATTKDSGLF